MVAIARDPGSYVRLIAAWGPGGRFPVLFDDGSGRAAEHIARFVRAYQPERVIEIPERPGWPDDPMAQRNAIESSLLAAWDVADNPPRMTALAERFAELNYRSPALVVANSEDPAWPAALALAAGRGLPIAWVNTADQTDVNKTISRTGAGLLAEQIEAGAERTRLLWRGLGDELDAIALCLNVPARMEIGNGEHLALTDVLGRHNGHLEQPENTNPKRWAWTSQIFGSESESAYRAMCSLFLSQSRAWLFDGYPVREPFTQYDLQPAAAALETGGFDVEIIDAPQGNRLNWRTTASRPLDASFVMVNTRGAPDRFDLDPGQTWTPDVPHLHQPAAVHFIHSWSAVRPNDPSTIAGAWLARGAYAYFGSVEEPYLQAFVPPAAVAARFRGGLPWAAATRFDGDNPVWKLASFGDPLLTSAAALKRIDIPEGFGAGTITLLERAEQAIQSRQFSEAARDYVRAGRDDLVVQLAADLLQSDRQSFTPALAKSAAMPAFREQNARVLTAAVSVLDRRTSDALGATDALWHLAFLRLKRQDDAAMIAVLQSRLRPRVLVRDARELVDAIVRHRGAEARAAAIAEVIRSAPSSRQAELARELDN